MVSRDTLLDFLDKLFFYYNLRRNGAISLTIIGIRDIRKGQLEVI